MPIRIMFLCQSGMERNIVCNRQAGDQVVELEDEADVLAPVLRQLCIRHGGQGLIEEAGFPVSGAVKSAENVEQR